MVAFDVVPIINIPGYGDTSAVTVVDQLKIKSQNDRALLDQAKDLVSGSFLPWKVFVLRGWCRSTSRDSLTV